MADVAVQLSDVSKRYGKKEALTGVDLTVEAGGVTALLGPNGAGKTTIVRLIATLLKPDSGRVSVFGHDVVGDARTVKQLVGLTGQYTAVDEILTGRENLEMVARLYHLSKTEARDRANGLLDRFSLSDVGDDPVSTYSGGMRRRLDLAASLVLRPRLLILDEPTTAVDVRARLEIWREVEQLVADGTTVLLTTQYLEEADRLADRVVILDEGRVVDRGSPLEIKRSLGGERLSVTVADPRDVPQVMELLAPFGEPRTDEALNPRLVTIPVSPEQAGDLVPSALRQLQANGALAQVSLHPPSLDDVLLAIPGRRPTGESAPENHDTARRTK